MPVDYSKWDALELSDDSDIEVHPNVDKQSFIRAKQNQIHQQRYERKHQIETLKYEGTVNDGFMRRIDGLLAALQSHKDEADKRNPDELMFQSIMESTGDPDEDQPPPRPEGVHTAENEMPTYSKMMATLVDQVKVEVDKTNPANRFGAYVTEVKNHRSKVESLQRQLLDKLLELEKEEHRKITSEDIHTGFDSSHINKSKPAESSSTSKPASKPKSDKVQAVELLNPGAAKDSQDKEQSPGADADIDEPADDKGGDDDEDEVQPTELGKQFAQIKIGDYRACLEFISAHPTVIAERETDGLLILAFNSQLDGDSTFAKQCVHQALLLQYCRSLGRDGVGLFFKRIITKGHQAQKVFLDDVNDTYERIRTRTKEIAAQRKKEDEEGGVEQIQLHAVDPGTSIMINVPEKGSSNEGVQRAREIFDAFPPGLQRALESGKLDEVNKVLGKMSVEEAEEIVGLLGEGGMLSLEEQIIDATTEEGQAALKKFEEQERANAASSAAASAVAEVGAEVGAEGKAEAGVGAHGRKHEPVPDPE